MIFADSIFTIKAANPNLLLADFNGKQKVIATNHLRSTDVSLYKTVTSIQTSHNYYLQKHFLKIFGLLSRNKNEQITHTAIQGGQFSIWVIKMFCIFWFFIEVNKYIKRIKLYFKEHFVFSAQKCYLGLKMGSKMVDFYKFHPNQKINFFLVIAD
jgi:hypothetical protein